VSKLIFRCDANERQGYGHFVRCYELALALKEHHPEIILLFLGDFSDHAVERLRDKEIDYFITAAENPFLIATITAQITVNKDFLWIDSYLVQQSFFDSLTDINVCWGVFDDFQKLNFKQASLVVNFRLDAQKIYHYQVTNEALGVSYMPINQEFSRIREKQLEIGCKENVRSILVCLGGSDLHNTSLRLATLTSECFPSSQITLVVSKQDDYAILNQKNITILNMQKSLAPLIQDVDLIVSGGGRLKYEACYCGIPNAVLSQTKEQLKDTWIFTKYGLSVDLGLSCQFNENAIRPIISKLAKPQFRQQMRKQQLNNFDKNSREKLANIVSQVFSMRI